MVLLLGRRSHEGSYDPARWGEPKRAKGVWARVRLCPALLATEPTVALLAQVHPSAHFALVRFGQQLIAQGAALTDRSLRQGFAAHGCAERGSLLAVALECVGKVGRFAAITDDVLEVGVSESLVGALGVFLVLLAKDLFHPLGQFAALGQGHA